MNYEVTAIRKRPQTFNDLVGQDFIVATLTNSLLSRKIANAYLFSGPRGVGKTSAARILARSINCAQGMTPAPCGTCDACREISKGNSLDVIEIDGASHTSVNDVRIIRDEVLFSPSSLRYKIYIIDEVHMLSNSAFNALLKTIEEPPPYIVFIFATTEIHKVPATIRSRCQQYSFRLLSIEDITQKLVSVTEEVGIQADKEALLWIAREATGSMRDAYTLFDQIASFSDGNINMKKIQAKLGLVGLEEISNLVFFLSQGKVPDALEAVNTIFYKGVAEEQILISLLEYFRSLLLIKNGISKESILGYSKESFQDAIVNSFTISQTEKALELILDLLRNFRFSLNQRFELELLIHRLGRMHSYITSQEILTKIEALKKDILSATGENLPKHENSSTQESRAVRQKEQNLSSAQVIRQIIENIGRQKLTLASSLQKNTSSELKNGELIINFREEDRFAAEFVGREKSDLTQRAEQILACPVKIKIVVEPSQLGTEQSPDEGEQIIKKIFKGNTIKGE